MNGAARVPPGPSVLSAAASLHPQAVLAWACGENARHFPARYVASGPSEVTHTRRKMHTTSDLSQHTRWPSSPRPSAYSGSTNQGCGIPSEHDTSKVSFKGGRVNRCCRLLSAGAEDRIFGLSCILIHFYQLFSRLLPESPQRKKLPVKRAPALLIEEKPPFRPNKREVSHGTRSEKQASSCLPNSTACGKILLTGIHDRRNEQNRSVSAGNTF